jgi:transposase
MKSKHKYVGLDVHKDTIVIAIADEGRSGEIRDYGTISNDLHALEKALAKIGSDGSTLHVVYEAGPTGFVVYRRLQQLRIDCIVAAPSKIPRQSGDKLKTDRRDAAKLARLHRAGELTAIHVPDEVDESIRDLCRARSDAMEDLRRAKQRLKMFLLRLGYRYRGNANWSVAHVRYLRELALPLPVHHAVLEGYLHTIDQAGEQLARLEEMVEAKAVTWRLYPIVSALMCLRGFQTVAATTLVAEIGDARRFERPRHMMAFLGLIPSERSTGATRRQGSITKTGNGHARWMMIEASHSAHLPPKVSAPLSRRQEGQPEIFKSIAWKAQTRLHKRYWQLAARKLMTAKIQIAVARELTGFVWDVLCHAWQKHFPAAPGPATPSRG